MRKAILHWENKRWNRLPRERWTLLRWEHSRQFDRSLGSSPKNVLGTTQHTETDDHQRLLLTLTFPWLHMWMNESTECYKDFKSTRVMMDFSLCMKSLLEFIHKQQAMSEICHIFQTSIDKASKSYFKCTSLVSYLLWKGKNFNMWIAFLNCKKSLLCYSSMHICRVSCCILNIGRLRQRMKNEYIIYKTA